jgi:type II secretory pathway component GspD/PulD (secretin)
VGSATTAITASLLDNNLQIAISNIMGDASTEVLASPQVSTLDNTEAQVFMGDKVSIRVIDDSGESSTQLVETGIKLTVTPHVSGDNRILLDLHPENNSYGYDEKGQVVISTQEAKTKVVVADGETVVIGGLTRNENTESESGIPFLKDIPLLGNLFKYSRKAVTKRDLIIFVTPRIIRNYVGSVELSEASAEGNGAPSAKKAQTTTEPTDSETPIVEPKQQPAQEQPKSEPSEAPAAPAIEEEDGGWN